LYLQNGISNISIPTITCDFLLLNNAESRLLVALGADKGVLDEGDEVKDILALVEVSEGPSEAAGETEAAVGFSSSFDRVESGESGVTVVGATASCLLTTPRADAVAMLTMRHRQSSRPARESLGNLMLRLSPSSSNGSLASG